MSLSITSALRRLMRRHGGTTRQALRAESASLSVEHAPQRWAEVANVPVFDAQHRKVGFIAAPRDAGCRQFTPAAWMQRCMAEPVCWLPADARTMDTLPVETSVGYAPHAHPGHWQRIALTHDDSLVGIVLVAPAHEQAA
jgi:hypothetical protein